MSEKLIQECDRARQAAAVIESPVYQEAMESYEQRLMEEWQNSPARDTEGREKIWLMIKTAKTVRRNLEELMETGKLATIQLEQERAREQRQQSSGIL